MELIKSYYEFFNKKDFSQMTSLLDEDVCHELNEGEVQVGRPQFQAFMKVMDEHYEEQVKDLVVFQTNDKNRYSAEFFIEGIYKKTQSGLPPARGQKYRLRVGAFFETRGNKISRVTNYYNLRQWISLVQ